MSATLTNISNVRAAQSAVLIGTLGFAAMDACSKQLVTLISPGALLLWRSVLIVAVLLVPLLVWRGQALWRTTAPFTVGARALTMAATSLFIILALERLPFADVLAIYFVSPFLTALLAAAWLKDPLPLRTVLGCLAALVGVVLIMRPGGATAVSGAWGYALPLLAAATSSLQDIFARKARGHAAPETLLIYSVLMSLGMGVALLALGVPAKHFTAWWPPLAAWVWLGLAALSGGISFYCMIRAMQWAPPSATAPLRYLNLMWAGLLGALFWNEIPGLAALVGMGLILGAGIATAWAGRSS